MKYFMSLLIAAVLVVSAGQVSYVYAGDTYQDTPIDQMGDWAATLGKDGVERDRILAERKTARASKRAEREAKKAAKEAGKSGEHMKKKLGLN